MEDTYEKTERLIEIKQVLSPSSHLISLLVMCHSNQEN